jgi:hypothetical protein
MIQSDRRYCQYNNEGAEEMIFPLFPTYTAVQKNRVHFKNQAIKFSSILCFVNVDFDIIFVNRL